MRLAILIVVGVISTASADTSSKGKADATVAYTEGQRLYLAEDYLGAAKQFRIAFKLDPDPAYLFNIAQSYRFAKKCGKSAKYYRQFLGVVPNPPNKMDVQKYLAEQTICARSQTDTEPEPVLDPDKVEPDKVEPDKGNPDQGNPDKSNPDKSNPDQGNPDKGARRDPDPIRHDSDPGHTKRRLGLGAFAVGAVGVAVGVGFGLRIKSLQQEREDLCVPDPNNPGKLTCPNINVREPELQKSADRARVWMITGFAVGGVAIAAGAYLYVTGRRGDPGVAVIPVQGGAVLSWTMHP